MSSFDSLESRQNNELEALQAIYCDDLIDLRSKGAWNKWQPLNFILKLNPQQGGSGVHEINAQIELHITCSENYPKSVPNIILLNSRGLSNAELVQLQNELEEKANNLKGEEMIFQLSQHVQEFLHVHNKPASKSFYDEMLQRKKERELKELQAKQLEEDRQRKYVIEEVQRRQEILKAESKWRKENKYNSENSEENLDASNYSHIQRKNSSTESSDDCLCDHKGTKIIDFGGREIECGQCIRHSSENNVIFNGIDKNTGEILIVSEWTVKIRPKIDVSAIQRQISSIEQELNYLMKLKHPNLVRYQNIKYEHFSESEKFVVYILKDFIHGIPTSLFFKQNLTVDLELMKFISRNVLFALDYLHRNNVFQKYMTKAYIYLSNKGILISDYSIHSRLCDLITQSHKVYSKKSDIYNFGVFVLSLIKPDTDKNNIEVPTNIPSDLSDFLHNCLQSEEKDRFTTAQLLNHSFLRKPIVHFAAKNQFAERDREKDDQEFIPNELSNISQANGQSRINMEFEFLQHLGRGAFGDVIKVRNKLDGGYYAIKRIKLNPKNKQLNKKIVREVKLLSRLNHENVVRYYNSWIETSIDCDDAETTASISERNGPIIQRKDEFTLNDDIEDLAPPPIKNSSINYSSKSHMGFESSSSEDDSSDEDEVWPVYKNESDSDGIEFEHNSSETVSITSSFSVSRNDEVTEEILPEIQKRVDFMYIQMEFCEKSTLRTAIDDNLYLEEDRVWRLFREIVEGLAHIHQQGMIHRDLKPVNIFLDSEDHVKIGDFGLATTDIKSKQNEFLNNKSLLESDREITADESKTGHVGTALYVAPEIGSASKVCYNQKVDIYSLGIILFEMCYRPIETGMERIKLLTGLRLKEIIFPEDFAKKNEKQELLIRLLLTHDISQRPTSIELLQSEHFPPPVLEECELRELVRHTLSNPHLKGYKYLIASCFKQSVTPAQDITYDRDPTATSINVKPFQIFDYVIDTTKKIFKKHGGQNLATPILMPKTKQYDQIESTVKLMTHFGSIVSLPHDLRVPFARYVAWNGITSFKRYAIERVYREKKVFGFIPRELYECAFDIVTPTPGNLMADSEILCIVNELFNEIPGLKSKHIIIRLNHYSLLKSILLHCGIKQKHEEVFTMISDTKEGKVPKYQMQNYLITLGLSDNSINSFLNIINSEMEVSKTANYFQMITKKKSGEASQLAKQALQDIKAIAQNAEAFGVNFDIVVTPGLVYNIQQCSGAIFQFVCEKKKHKHNTMDVLAAGGRYDSTIACYRNIMLQANILNRDIQQSAVGVSISLDKIIHAIQKEQPQDLPHMSYLDVGVCSVGTKPMLKEKAKILRKLWDAGISSCLIENTNIEEIQEQLNELRIAHVVMLKDNEQGTIRVRSWDKERFHEKTFNANELVEQIQRILKAWNENSLENPQTSLPQKFDSRMSFSEHSTEANVDIIFSTYEKLSSNSRKRYDNQIRSQLNGLFKKFHGFVIVLGLSVDSNIIRSLTSYLEFDNEVKFQKSVSSVIEKHQKHKMYLNDVCDEIYEHKTKRTDPVIVLYSLSEYFYKVIV